MSTENLTGIDALRKQIAKNADEVRARAKVVLDNVDEIERQRRKDAEDAVIVARLLDQQHADNLAVVQEEAQQMLNILGKIATPTPDVADDEPAPEPPAPQAEPVVAAVAPEPPATVAPTPTRKVPVVEAPSAPTAVKAIVDWTRRLGFWGWLLALLGAYIAFRWSGDHMLFRISRTGDGYWDDIQKIIWRTGVTGFGFYLGGSLGMFLRWLAGQIAAAYRNDGIDIDEEEVDMDEWQDGRVPVS